MNTRTLNPRALAALVKTVNNNGHVHALHPMNPVAPEATYQTAWIKPSARTDGPVISLETVPATIPGPQQASQETRNVLALPTSRVTLATLLDHTLRHAMAEQGLDAIVATYHSPTGTQTLHELEWIRRTPTGETFDDDAYNPLEPAFDPKRTCPTITLGKGSGLAIWREEPMHRAVYALAQRCADALDGTPSPHNHAANHPLDRDAPERRCVVRWERGPNGIELSRETAKREVRYRRLRLDSDATLGELIG